jgi:hypothetical protein
MTLLPFMPAYVVLGLGFSIVKEAYFKKKLKGTRELLEKGANQEFFGVLVSLALDRVLVEESANYP